MPDNPTPTAAETNDILGAAEGQAPAPEKQEEASAPSVADEVRSVLKELVGEGKKFSDEEALAKGKVEADNHIANLERQIKELREDLTRRDSDSTRQAIADLKNELQNKGTKDESREPTTPSLTAEDLEKLVDEKLTQRETKNTVEQNVSKTNKALVELYGSAEKAVEAVRQRSEELGISVKDVQAMAAKSPTAVLALFKGERPASSKPIGGQSTINTLAQPSQGVDPNSKAAFDELRKRDQKTYWSPATQQKIYQLVKEGKYA